jgi:hypothetical protein
MCLRSKGTLMEVLVTKRQWKEAREKRERSRMRGSDLLATGENGGVATPLPLSCSRPAFVAAPASGSPAGPSTYTWQPGPIARPRGRSSSESRHHTKKESKQVPDMQLAKAMQDLATFLGDQDGGPSCPLSESGRLSKIKHSQHRSWPSRQ